MKKLIIFGTVCLLMSSFNFGGTSATICDYYKNKADEFFEDGWYDAGWDVLIFVQEQYPDCYKQWNEEREK